MSDGKKGFFSKIIENVKQEMTVNPEMKVSCSSPSLEEHMSNELYMSHVS